ncbi:hypothetical protein M5K25_018970 [Dendrobium thyrsiflorum]|uniref:Uncharacterized protein n=1 Tax=Dendrobium thyrsiflorum TaxID=117978 RepID=A0ABD0UDG7_DENTH
MSSHRNQLIEEAKIEDLLQEVARLKLRLSMIERKKNVSPLDRNFKGVRGKYAAPTASRSLVPTKSLRSDNEGILDDQISSTHKDMFEGPPRPSPTPPSIESSFEEFEDPLSKSSSLPL